MVVGGAALLVVGFVAEEGLPPLGAREIGLILGIAIVGGAIPFALFYLALAKAPATQVSTWFFLIPVVGVLCAWLLLGERPTLQLVVGLVAVSVGLWLVLAARTPGKELLVDSTPPL
jgi:drug/metabolite transporter (DMT)-like permease